MVKFDWEALAKKAKSQNELAKLLREGPVEISGISEWDKRMEGRCPYCKKLLKENELVDVHIYYSHSNEYKDAVKRVQKEMKKKGQLDIEAGNLTTMQSALIEALGRAAKKK